MKLKQFFKMSFLKKKISQSIDVFKLDELASDDVASS